MEIHEYFPMWNKLTAAQQNEIQSVASPWSVGKGKIIHNGSYDCTGLLLIRSGQLRGYINSAEGREITIYRLFERDICLLSASCIMNSIQFEITIEAEKDTDMWIIPPEIFRSIMDESAALANYTSELMATRLSDAMWIIEQVMWKSLDKRVAAFLLEEAEIEGVKTLNITHETIGNHLGSQREVITRMLRYFQNEGMVKLSRGTVEIVDVERLKKIEDK